MKKKIFRERYNKEEENYIEIPTTMDEIVKAIVEESVKEEKPVKRGRKKSVKSDK